MSAERFNVVIWHDGHYEYFLRDVPAGNAMRSAKRCIDQLGRRDLIDMVMVTDSDDHCNFMWERGKGVVFPSREEARQ